MKQDDLVNFFKRAIQPLKDRVLLMVGRAILTAIKDDKAIQQAQLSALAGESMDKVERYQEFGFTSNPPPGTEAIILSIGSNRENMVIVATDNRELRKKNLEKGECALYTHDGTYVYLKKDGQVEIKTSTKVTVDAPLTQFTGDVIVDKTLLVKDEATFQKNINVTLNAKVTLLVQAGGYTGPAGGSPGPVVINVPVQLGSSAPVTSGAAITTTANVTGGGTNMATIKATFNSHTHPDGSPNSGVPNSTL